VKKRLNWTRENEIIAQLANFHAAMWPALWRTKEVRDLDIPLSFSLNFFFFFCKSGWLASSPEKNYNNYPACVFTREAFTGFFQLLHHHLFFLFINSGKNFITGTARNGHNTFVFSRVRIATNERIGNGCVMSIIQPRPWSHSIHTTV
jgi:hypothetical protein